MTNQSDTLLNARFVVICMAGTTLSGSAEISKHFTCSFLSHSHFSLFSLLQTLTTSDNTTTNSNDLIYNIRRGVVMYHTVPTIKFKIQHSKSSQSMGMGRRA